MIQLIFILGQRFSMTWKQVKMTASPYLYTVANYKIEESKKFVLSNLCQADIGSWTPALAEVSCDFSAVRSSVRPEYILRMAL